MEIYDLNVIVIYINSLGGGGSKGNIIVIEFCVINLFCFRKKDLILEYCTQDTCDYNFKAFYSELKIYESDFQIRLNIIPSKQYISLLGMKLDRDENAS
ncbi:hypothetical protein SDJN02_17676, partial [Cucurbita argyrosperma subsp. argyrosperma]